MNMKLLAVVTAPPDIYQKKNHWVNYVIISKLVYLFIQDWKIGSIKLVTNAFFSDKYLVVVLQLLLTSCSCYNNKCITKL